MACLWAVIGFVAGWKIRRRLEPIEIRQMRALMVASFDRAEDAQRRANDLGWVE